MEPRPHNFGKSFLIWWVLSNTIGWFLGIGLMFLIDYLGLYSHVPPITSLVVSGVVLLLQSLVLRRRIPKASLWFFSSVVTVLIGIIVIDVFVFPNALRISNTTFRDFYSAGIISGTVIGLLVGFSQWYVIRKYFSRAILWIFINPLVWCLGIVSHHFFILSPFSSGYLPLYALPVIGVTLPSLISGMNLIWLYNQNSL